MELTKKDKIIYTLMGIQTVIIGFGMWKMCTNSDKDFVDKVLNKLTDYRLVYQNGKTLRMIKNTPMLSEFGDYYI